MKKIFSYAFLAVFFALTGCEMVSDNDKAPAYGDISFEDDPFDAEGRIILDGERLAKAHKPDIRDFNDFIKHFTRCNVKINEVNGLASEPVGAESAVRLRIGDRYIGVYRFDISTRKARSRLAQIKKAKELKILGIPFDARVNGGFVMIDADAHNDGKAIIDAFESFD